MAPKKKQNQLWRRSVIRIVEWGLKQLKSEGNIAVKELKKYEMELERLKKPDHPPTLAVRSVERKKIEQSLGISKDTRTSYSWRLSDSERVGKPELLGKFWLYIGFIRLLIIIMFRYHPRTV